MTDSVNPNLGPQWRTTTDRDGRRAYVTPKGSVVSKDGTGPTPVTVLYPGHDWSRNPDYGMVDSIGEGKAWAEEAERHLSSE